MNTFFSDKIILWRKMAKIWLKIWLKVKENGTKKIKLAKMVAKEKKILVRTLFLYDYQNIVLLNDNNSLVHKICKYKYFHPWYIL